VDECRPLIPGRFFSQNIIPGMLVGLVSLLSFKPPDLHAVTLRAMSESTMIPLDSDTLQSIVTMFPGMGQLLNEEAELGLKMIALAKIHRRHEITVTQSAATASVKASFKFAKEETEGGELEDMYEALTGPPTNIEAARLAAVRRMTSQRTLNAFQVIQMLSSGLFLKRVELVVMCYHAVRDRDSFGEVLYAMSQAEQVGAARRLGYKNIFSWRRPNLHYHLRLSNPDEYEVARQLAKMAVVGGDSSNWNNLMINGRERRIAENSNFWTTVEGPLKMNDKPTNILDFDFETTSQELGRAVQVDPVKPTSKPPGTKRLKLKHDEVLSNFAFNFNLRRYSWGPPWRASCSSSGACACSSGRAAAVSCSNTPISVYRLGEIPIQSCGVSVSALRGKAGAMLNAHTVLRVKRQRSAREAIYRNRPIARL